MFVYRHGTGLARTLVPPYRWLPSWSAFHPERSEIPRTLGNRHAPLETQQRVAMGIAAWGRSAVVALAAPPLEAATRAASVPPPRSVPAAYASPAAAPRGAARACPATARPTPTARSTRGRERRLSADPRIARAGRRRACAFQHARRRPAEWAKRAPRAGTAARSPAPATPIARCTTRAARARAPRRRARRTRTAAAATA